MIEHVVLMRFKEGTGPDVIEALATAFSALPQKIDVIQDYQFGENFAGDRSAGHTHLLYSRFASREDLQAYAGHPDHVDLLENQIKPILESSVVGDLDRS